MNRSCVYLLIIFWVTTVLVVRLGFFFRDYIILVLLLNELSALLKHRRILNFVRVVLKVALRLRLNNATMQGTAVRVEFGDATTAADAAGSHTISRSFPHTYGQPLAHFLRATAKVPDAHIITEHPATRFVRLMIGCVI